MCIKQEKELIVIKIINYLAKDEVRLRGFVNFSGIDYEGLKACIHDKESHSFILEYLLQNESELVNFCEEAGVTTDKISRLVYKKHK